MIFNIFSIQFTIGLVFVIFLSVYLGLRGKPPPNSHLLSKDPEAARKSASNMATVRSKMPTIMIDGRQVPQLAFGMGTYWSKRGDPNLSRALIDTVKTAINVGFTHMDCSDNYNTEPELGVAIKELEKEQGIPRSSIYVTTKCMNLVHDLPTALNASLKALQLDYVDLYLIHTPFKYKSQEEISTAWAQMEELQAKGLARSIGVSNFRPQDLEPILKTCRVTPVLNQIEFHPYLQHPQLSKLMKDHNVATVGYGPLVSLRKEDQLEGGPIDEYVTSLAAKYGVTEDNILLRWQMDKGFGIVTTSSKESRLRNYLRSADFTLTEDESAEIDRLGLKRHFRAYMVGNGRFDPEDRE